MSDKTALAEAEIEYDDAHVSPSIYVKFAFPSEPGLNAVIWTTTPWTLPANYAIAYHPDYSYVTVRARGERYIVAEKLADAFVAACKLEEEGAREPFAVERFALLREARHPFMDRASRLLPADYVTLEQGTGLVHTAPGHGADDYLLGKKFGLPIEAPVDDGGVFTDGPVEGRARLQGQPEDRAAPGAVGRAALTAVAEHGAQLSDLLALQEADHLPRDLPVVRAHGRPERAAEAGRARRDRQDAVDSAVGRKPHSRHDRESSRLGALAPARVGRADPRALQEGRRGARRFGRLHEPRRRPVRRKRLRRLVHPQRRGAGPARGPRRHRRGQRQRHRRRLVRVGRLLGGGVRRQARPQPRRAADHRPLSGRLRPAPRLVSLVIIVRCSNARARAVSGGAHARLRARRARQALLQVVDREGAPRRHSRSSTSRPRTC